MTTNRSAMKSESGDYRFLLSAHTANGIDGHAYVRCRKEPDKGMQNGASRLLDEIEKRSLEFWPPAVLTTPIVDDAVEKILIPLSAEVAATLAEYATLKDPKKGHLTIWFMPGNNPINVALLALH